MEKAKQLAVLMGVKFEPNNSWLQHWKNSCTWQLCAADPTRGKNAEMDDEPGLIMAPSKKNVLEALEVLHAFFDQFSQKFF